jgi:hypothetical protein
MAAFAKSWRRVLINRADRSAAFMGYSHRLSKKLHSLPSSIRRIIQPRGHSCAGPLSQARPFGSRLILSDRF